MACDKNILQLISCYIDGETTPEETTLVESHLQQCTDCRKLVDNWKEQRTVFEWAYMSEQPEELEWSRLADAREKRMPINRAFPRIYWPKRPVWAFAAVIAATAIIGVGIYFATLPPLLKTGERLIAKDTPISARMENDIKLKIGRGSQIVRIDARTIRVEKGWVDASVKHGSGLRVLTKRLEVIDKGTEFKAGTGDHLDYVLVEEGEVAVKRSNVVSKVAANRALLAADDEPAKIVALPVGKSADNQEGKRLATIDTDFFPTTAEDLDWNDGLKKLAARFPDVRYYAGRGSCLDETRGLAYRYGYSGINGVAGGIRDHFTDIAQAMAGDRVDSDGWEIPIAIMQLYGTGSKPYLTEDMYYLRLVCEGGKIVWRFAGAKGGQIDYPMQPEAMGDYGPTAQELIAVTNNIIGDGHIIREISFGIADWPGKMKPSLKLTLAGMPFPQSLKDQKAMQAEVLKATKVDMGRGSSSLIYLDPERKHKILIASNYGAGNEIRRTRKLNRAGNGTATIFAISTDVPLIEPQLGPGIYLLRMVSGKLEILNADGRLIKVLRYEAQNTGAKHQSAYGFSTEAPEGAESIQLGARIAKDKDTYSFCFYVKGREDRTFAEGWIRVKKP